MLTVRQGFGALPAHLLLLYSELGRYGRMVMDALTTVRPSEPSLQEILGSDITALVMQSDNVKPSHVASLAKQAAASLKCREDGWSR